MNNVVKKREISSGMQRNINIVIAVVLVAILGFLFSQTRNVDFDAHNDIIGNLRQLKQIDAEWNIDEIGRAHV